MARDFHPERSDPRGLQKNQRAIEALLDRLFDLGGEELFVVLAGRAGGQTILQGVTLEGGLVVNDLGADVDTRFEADANPNLLFLDAGADSGNGRVGVRTAAPADVLHLDPGATTGGIRIANSSLGSLGSYLNSVLGPHLASHTNSLGVSTANFAAVRLVFSGLGYQVQTSPATAAGVGRTFTNRLVTEINGNIGIGGASYGGGVGVLFIANRTTAPGSSPVGGVIPYAHPVATGKSNLLVKNEAGETTRLTGVDARSPSAANSSSSTLIDVPGLSFDVEAGKTYEVHARLYTDCAASEGIDSKLVTTATIASVIGEKTIWGHSFSFPVRSRFTAFPVGNAFSQAALTNDGRIEITATFTTTTAGVVKVQFSNFNATGTATVQRGSTFHLREIT